MARRTKLTPDLTRRICKALEMGSTYKLAIMYGDICSRTFYMYMRKGREQNRGKYREFFKAVKAAEARAYMGALSTIMMAQKGGDWKAAAWLLERRRPEEYSQRRDIKITSKGASAAEVIGQLMNELAASDMSREERQVLRKLVDVARKRQASEEDEEFE